MAGADGVPSRATERSAMQGWRVAVLGLPGPSGRQAFPSHCATHEKEVVGHGRQGAAPCRSHSSCCTGSHWLSGLGEIVAAGEQFVYTVNQIVKKEISAPILLDYWSFSFVNWFFYFLVLCD